MDIDLGNYTGPYWSDGKVQPSVEFGTADPKTDLDKLSRLHDTAYAHYKDRAHREAADAIYAEEARKLVGKFPHLAADVVQYGNYTGRQASKLASDIGKFSFIPGLGPVYGMAKFAIGNIKDSQSRINGTYLQKERAAVQALYSRDPMPHLQAQRDAPGVFERARKFLTPTKVEPVKTDPQELIRRQAERMQNYLNLQKQAEASMADPRAHRGYSKPPKGALVQRWNGPKKKKKKRMANISVCPQ